MSAYYTDDTVTLHHGDALSVARELPSGSADCIVTSPPYYGLRDYGTEGQYGLEDTPEAYIGTLCAVFDELRRVLHDNGTAWLNLGDSYSSEPPGRSPHAMRSSTLQAARAARVLRESVRTAAINKTRSVPRKNLMGIPWRVALALQSNGWILRNAIVWHKPNAMPESVTDRLSSRYEMVFMLTKQPRYWFNLDAIRQEYDGDRDISRRARTGRTNKPNSISSPWGVQTNMAADGSRHDAAHTAGRNPGDIWEQPTQPFAAAHFAVMALAVAERCVQAGCKPGGIVLDPFSGSGTTGLAATKHARKYVGIDLNRDYLDLSLRTRLRQGVLDLGTAS